MGDVTTTRKEYDEQLEDVTRNRDAVRGERAVKKKREAYLPPLASMCCRHIEDVNGYTRIISGSVVTSEGAASYNKYLSLAYFYGATGRTVDGLTGLILRKDPIIDLPSPLEYIKDNADGSGEALLTQADTACKEAFISPRSGLLVDYPAISQGMSVAQAEALNLRPKILHYPFESIRNWHYDTVNNQSRLTMLVLEEQREIMTDRFAVDCETVYRVLEIIEGVYYQSVEDEKGEEIEERRPVLVNGSTVSEIPFFLIEVGAECKSIITDLVDANYNHYRFFADYAAKEHASAFPVFCEAGAESDDQNIMIGPGAKWSNRSPDAKFSILQSASDGGSMRQYLLDMEQRMAALGAEMLKPRISGAESAEAKSLDQVAQNSTVASVANAVSMAYRKALRFCAVWMGVNADEVDFELSTDYNPSVMSGADLTALVGAFQSGAMSFETFYWNLLKGERANPETNIDDEKALIAGAELGV